MLFVQPMPMDEVAAANRPVAAEVYTMKVCRTHAAPDVSGMQLAQAPGTPGSPSPNQGSGSLLEPPGSPAADTPVAPPRPNSVNNGTNRSPFDTSTGTPNNPSTQTPVPAVPEPARPDATTPGTPSPTSTPPPIDDTKSPATPTDTPTGAGGTSGPMLAPPNQTPAPSSADPGTASGSAAPSSTTPPASVATPPTSTAPSPTDMGASGTR